MGKSKIGLFSVLLVISVLWKPAFTSECSVGCKGNGQGLPANTKYNYAVDSTVKVFLTGADQKDTSVRLNGQVSVVSLGNCENELTVQNVVISGPDGKKYPSPPGINKPVRFALQDGRLSSDICVSEGDTRRSINIKRAIISLLQTEQKSTTQVDIFGACPTEISYSSEGSATLVHRTRNLARCAHREQGQTGLISSVLNENAEIKETQALQSTIHVETKVNNGVPEKVSASEEYLYKPFSVGENGARAEVLTKLTLTGKAAGSGGASHCTLPRSIIFDVPRGTPVLNNANNVLAAVKDTANAIGKEATEASAGAFASLIRILRVTSKDDLIKVWNQVKGNNVEKRVYLDGLLRTGTGPSIEASIQILKNNELDTTEHRLLVFLSLGNAKQVSNEALKAATSLLDDSKAIKEIYLGVGALAGSYCRSVNCHSEKSEGIVALSNKLGAKLQNCKPKGKIQEDNVVAVLKGIRNIGHLENSLVDKLVQCANDNNVKARVKAAVLDALQADPCSAKIKKTSLDILKNRQLDSEIRIKAYQVVIACPCSKSANEIKNVLDSEPVHQVGRYITSSLRAIRASSNPDKQHAKQHYANIGTPNKFNVDDRKYSHYREASFNVDALGIGGDVEQSVIYSQNSFIPRSASLNITTEIFGHRLNVLELGGRQGNLDLVIEHFLGPKGILKTKGAQELYNIIIDTLQKSNEKVQSSLNRGRRSIKTEIDGFDKNLKAEELHYDNELDLDLYVKLFGTDAIFLSLGDDKGFDYNRVLENILKTVNQGIGNSQHLSNELRSHLLFLDAELAYPTTSGLPLKLDLTGAITARVDFSTNFDIKQCISNPKNAKIDIKLVPSTDIEITGSLLIDADAVVTGLKVITNLHSSTGGHLVAKVLDNGNGIDIQLGLPVEKQEIIVASNDLVYITAEKGHKEKQQKISSDKERKEYNACFDQLSGLLGLTLCSEVSLPFSVSGPEAQSSITKYLSKFPLSGQSKLKLVLEKNDLKGYHIRGLVKNDGKKTTLDLLFEAEGSKNRRTQIIASKIDSPTECGLSLSLHSPIKNLGAEVILRNTDAELTLTGDANLDSDKYHAKAGFNVKGNKQRSVYKPIFEYSTPEGANQAQIDGEIIREVNGPIIKYKFQGINIKLPSSQDPIAVQGFASRQEGATNVEWQIVSDLVTLKGHLKSSDINVEFFNKLNPVFNFILKGQYSPLGGEVTKNEIDLYYSGDCKDSQRRLIVGQYLKQKIVNDKNYNVITKNKLEILAIPFKISFDADIDPKKLEIELKYQNVDQKADLEVKARSQTKQPKDYSVKVIANVNKNGVEVLSKRDVINEDQSNFENYVDIKTIGKYELSGIVTHRVNPSDVKVGAVGHLKITGKKNEEIKFDVGATQTPSLYSSHAKISSSQGQLLDYLLKINSGANPNGQLKLVLKDAVAANGQYQVKDADGKGNGVLIVEIKKAQRKIKVDVKFHAKKPTFDGDFDVYLNWEKDNKDKICLSTKTKATDSLLDTKNKLEYGGKNTELNVLLKGSKDKDMKSDANVEIVLPNKRCLTFAYLRDINNKGGVVNGHAKVSLSDAPERGSEASIISYEGKIVNSNPEKAILDYQGELNIKMSGGKVLKNVMELKNQPAGGQKFKFDLQNHLTGNIVPKPASLSASASYLDNDNLAVDDQAYQLKASYGDDLNLDLNGKAVYNLEAKSDKKYLEDFTVLVRLPFEKAHDIKWVSHMLFLLPQSNEAEYTISEAVHLNGDVWKVDAHGKSGLHNGAGTVKVLVPHQEPVILDANYKADQSSDRTGLFTEVKAKYGKGKTVGVSVNNVNNHDGHLVSLKLNTPQFEKIKRLEIDAETKHAAPDSYFNGLDIKIDDRAYVAESVIVLSKAHPVLDLKYTNSVTGKTSRVYVKGTSLSSTQGKMEVKIDNVREISLDATSEANVQKDNVVFKIQANSEKLGWKNFIGTIESKDAGSGKRLEFHSTNDNKNVLSGSTSFLSKTEGQKTIIEGSGSVKVKDEQKTANFKYIRTILTEGNEKGVETFFKVALGERSYVAESRVTNLEYKNTHVYCEEKKQCAHAELQSKLDISKSGDIANVVNAGFDLRTLGVKPELGLVIRDEVSATRLPHYTLDLHANNDDSKYYLRVYSTPVIGHAKSGINIQLPSRVILLENSVSYPSDKTLPFPIKGELVLDLDKTKPGHKTSARFLVDFDVNNENNQKAVAEIGFNHPKINKEAVIRVAASSVRHNENAIKIETSAKLSHYSIGKDREAKILLDVSPTHLNFLINTPIVKVIEVEGSAAVKDKLQKADIKFNLLEGKTVKVEALVKDYTYYEFTTVEKDRKLSIIGHIEPEKKVDISADLILGKEKKNLVHGAVWLEKDQVKTDYGFDKANINYFYSAVHEDLTELKNKGKNLGQKAKQEIDEMTRLAQPSTNKLKAAYSEDFNKLSKEITDDRALQEISKELSDIIVHVTKLIEEVKSALEPIIDQLNGIYKEYSQKIQELYSKQLEPAIKDAYAEIRKAVKPVFDSIVDLVSTYVAAITDFLEKHKVELTELTNALGDIFKDLTRLLVAHAKEYRAKVDEIASNIIQWFKELPIFKEWSNIPIPEQATDLLSQAYSIVRPILPTPEAQAFGDCLNDYVLKKLKHEKVEDSKELKVVYQKLVTAVSSIIQAIRNQLNVVGVVPAGPLSWLNWNPSSTDVPTLGGSASVSVLRQILTGDIPDLGAIIRAYRPRSLDILEEVPAKLRAVVVNGQHIFSFDGRHLTLPGTCRYVLAHDFVDRNFTVLVQLAGGKPKAIVLEDKSGTIIELKDNGQVTLNGANHGFPVIEKDSFAYRQANGRIGLASLYGVLINCAKGLRVCHIEVNGFYLGKLRGLLGDGNNEPYDDFRLPNGKISASESEFGNAYRLAKSCPAAAVPEHSHHQLHGALPEACEKVLGGTSPLRALALLQDISPFRQACHHAVSSNADHSQQEACDLAEGYVSLAESGLLPPALPAACLSCNDNDKSRKIGETYEYKLPNKQADIIIAVETVKASEKTFKELVVPLVSQIIDQLKSKHCTDIKVHLVGLTPQYPYPILYDTDLKLKNAKVSFTDESRYDDLFKPIVTGNAEVDQTIKNIIDLVNGLRASVGIYNIEGGAAHILQLPLRPGAVKHLIYVAGEKCLPLNPLALELSGALYGMWLENNANAITFITPAKGLTIGGGKTADQIVGISKTGVLFLGDTKLGKDSAAARESLKWDDDCIAWAQSVNDETLTLASDNFAQLAPALKKKYLATAATAVTQSLLGHSQTQDCTCLQTDAYTARSVCTSSARKAITSRRK